MPVSGLPPILESVLNNCIKDTFITHWKIEGGSCKLIVYIEFQKAGLSANVNSMYEKEAHMNENRISKPTEICDLISFHETKIENSSKMESLTEEKSNKAGLKDIKEEPTLVNKEEHTKKDVENIKCTVPLDSQDEDSVFDHDSISPKSKRGSLSTIESQYELSSAILKESPDTPEMEKAMSPVQSKRASIGTLSHSSSKESLNDVEEIHPKKHGVTKFKRLSFRRKSSVSYADVDSIKSDSTGSPIITKENSKIISKVIKVLRRSTTHCHECNKLIKQSNKSKCTACDVFLCSDCIYHAKHNPDHKRYISLFSYPSDPNNEDYCRACGYITKIKHSYNTNFSCDLCPDYILCQGCMSQGMHGHHEDQLKAILKS